MRIVAAVAMAVFLGCGAPAEPAETTAERAASAPSGADEASDLDPRSAESVAGHLAMPDAEEAHRALGRLAAASADRLFLIGTHADAVGESALGAGLAPERITVVADHQALGAALRAGLRAGDLVLLKGSRGAARRSVDAGCPRSEI